MKNVKQVNIHQAKTELSRLIGDVLSTGEEIIIAKAGHPVVKLIPFRKRKKMLRKPGSAKGHLWIAADFEAPLPQEILNRFES